MMILEFIDEVINADKYEKIEKTGVSKGFYNTLTLAGIFFILGGIAFLVVSSIWLIIWGFVNYPLITAVLLAASLIIWVGSKFRRNYMAWKKYKMDRNLLQRHCLKDDVANYYAKH